MVATSNLLFTTPLVVMTSSLIPSVLTGAYSCQCSLPLTHPMPTASLHSHRHPPTKAINGLYFYSPGQPEGSRDVLWMVQMVTTAPATNTEMQPPLVWSTTQQPRTGGEESLRQLKLHRECRKAGSNDPSWNLARTPGLLILIIPKVPSGDPTIDT